MQVGKGGARACIWLWGRSMSVYVFAVMQTREGVGWGHGLQTRVEGV
jgi:hypothetical protein